MNLFSLDVVLILKDEILHIKWFTSVLCLDSAGSPKQSAVLGKLYLLDIICSYVQHSLMVAFWAVKILIAAKEYLVNKMVFSVCVCVRVRACVCARERRERERRRICPF